MKDLFTSLMLVLIMTFGLGVIYPFAVWAIAQTAFPHEANGSLIALNDRVVGSELLGQRFSDPAYFQGRGSVADYNAANSGGSNLGPTSRKLLERVESAASEKQSWNPAMKVPADLVTTSASGLDPHLSAAAAEFQIRRIAAARGTDESSVRSLVSEFTEGRSLGVFGVPRVNVLRLNLELDARFPRRRN